MDIQAVEQLVKLVANSSLYEVSIRDGQDSIRVKNSSNFQQTPASQAISSASPMMPSSPSNPAVEKKNLICSKHIGWLRLAEDTIGNPMIKVGDTVAIGQTVAYVGVLGQLIPVLSDKAGIIKAVLAENEQGIEYGTPLFELES